MALAVLLGCCLGVVAGSAAPALASTTQFHGVNWADPDDNFITGPNVPVGLSQSDNYATTYTKATNILKGFQALGVNTVRFGINEATTSSTWWNSYTAAFDAATALGMNVILCPWLQGGHIGDTTPFYQMWDTVVNKYGGTGNIYFDLMNEPLTMSSTDITGAAATWLARYPSVPRGRFIVPGTGSDTNLCAEGADPRLAGTLLSIHIYSMFGDSHTTEAAWISDFESNLCGYENRALVTEFGVATTTGVNYDGPRDGTNDLSFFYGITDAVRSLGVGSVLWTGVKENTQTVGPGPCENASCAITTLNSSGTSVSVTNQSVLDRLQYGWGIGSNSGSGGSEQAGVLRGTASNRCLDVPNTSTNDGTYLDIWDCNAGANQQWTYLPNGELVAYGDKCLDVPGHNTAAGTPVEIWTCNDGANQQWNLNSNGTVTSRESGLCLDVYATRTANGTEVETWTCNGASNQSWVRQ